MITKKQGKFGEVTEYVYYLDCGDVFMGIFQVKNRTCAVYCLLIKPQKIVSIISTLLHHKYTNSNEKKGCLFL